MDLRWGPAFPAGDQATCPPPLAGAGAGDVSVTLVYCEYTEGHAGSICMRLNSVVQRPGFSAYQSAFRYLEGILPRGSYHSEVIIRLLCELKMW